jgi:indole-3-glycerol phosphate synthase
LASQLPAILDRIVASKRQELERRRRDEPLDALRERAAQAPPTRSLTEALRRGSPALIAEVKRASPSRGVLRADLDAQALARTYADSGAAAISVLTEVQHFQGSLDDLRAVRATLDGRGDARPPILRKDFLFDAYHLFEARACGADAVLLIVAMLEPDLLADLLALASTLGLEGLVEVHDEQELGRALAADAQVIGINNRDLRTFEVDLATTEHLRPLIPQGRVVVAESGIHSRADVQRLRALGVNAVLIGEAVVTAEDPAAKIRELLG